MGRNGSPCGQLHLVSCVSLKLDRRARAERLYVSPWFCKARAYVLRLGAPWRILSAKYGVLDPQSVVEPYELTLNTLTVAKRRVWSRDVLEALKPNVDEGDTVVILAGLRYHEFVVPALRDRNVRVDVPLAGLGLGMQLSWFDNHSSATDG